MNRLKDQTEHAREEIHRLDHRSSMYYAKKKRAGVYPSPACHAGFCGGQRIQREREKKKIFFSVPQMVSDNSDKTTPGRSGLEPIGGDHGPLPRTLHASRGRRRFGIQPSSLVKECCGPIDIRIFFHFYFFFVCCTLIFLGSSFGPSTTLRV